MRVGATLPHRWEWTYEDLEELPDDGCRYEIVDGGLVVSPPPPLRHEFVVEQLKVVLRAAAPAQWRVLSPGVHLGRSYRLPDVVVLRADVDRSVGTAEPGDVLLAVEVVSPGSVTTDRVTKPGGVRRGRHPVLLARRPACGNRCSRRSRSPPAGT